MKKFIFIVSSLFIICSCREDENPGQESVSRTIIVYMAADNDLSLDAIADIREMKQNFSATGINLIVFVDAWGEEPYLLQINSSGEAFIKSYQELNSADTGTMQTIIREIAAMYPADEYGLILWSHGTSWLPAGSRLRSFGQDSGKEMNIADLAEVLPLHFKFILFDACLMGAVEVVYELRNTADYIIASSTETIAEGFPYHLILPELLKSNPDWPMVAQQYFDYYNNQQGVYRSATVSVVKTDELEALAYEMKRLMENLTPDETFNRTAVQRLDVYDEQYHFDLLDFVNKAFSDADRTAFISQLNRVVLYKNHTPEFIGQYAIRTYCGLSCYIPHQDRGDLNEFYKTLQWNTDTGIINITTKQIERKRQDKVSSEESLETVLPP
jgi:hypothetical protein